MALATKLGTYPYTYLRTIVMKTKLQMQIMVVMALVLSHGMVIVQIVITEQLKL